MASLAVSIASHGLGRSRNTAEMNTHTYTDSMEVVHLPASAMAFIPKPSLHTSRCSRVTTPSRPWLVNSFLESRDKGREVG